ncbi:prepilin-type N-terminal cleavage/methylation domain-containing protein [Limnobacter humi]|uniref:Prepilin-type N-terminal cleavage/methylation domain-containing protein n=1 Tax=Limnobacter humi TaxID=1778671 RepID=A0ABT1WE62_9BURK|nr:prepilin-type N-terminal cleavage/methylation domain-containing protein [Limnobacter humi]MCQ8895027.1 prepilin-type N-terminal cleavage/methylation domain-containing protein [Limnobacter humi]
MNSYSFRKHQAGITLIEVSIGLIIAAIVAAVAFVAFQNNARRTKVRENTTAITEIVAEAKQKFGRTNQYTALNGKNDTTDPAIISSTIPKAIASAGNTYGVKPILYGSGIDGKVETTPTGTYATLAWGGVPADQCYDLINAVAQATNAIYVVNTSTVSIGGASGTSVVSTTGTISAANATTACNAITTTGSLYLVFDRG